MILTSIYCCFWIGTHDFLLVRKKFSRIAFYMRSKGTHFILSWEGNLRGTIKGWQSQFPCQTNSAWFLKHFLADVWLNYSQDYHYKSILFSFVSSKHWVPRRPFHFCRTMLSNKARPAPNASPRLCICSARATQPPLAHEAVY